ncbi:hypothetical protein Pfo_004767 [Paulownia fortunei]|nr:hypothetical protein Pfo_004767 [Paulownia fortunei]
MILNEALFLLLFPSPSYPPKENTSSDVHSCDGVSTSAMERAQEIQANLSPHIPSLLKHLLRSHVTGGFWLGLPRKFCYAHLPKHDDTVVLVGENEQEFNTKYLVDKNGLSGGWRGFSIAHNLLERDVLVFQLTEPCKFKVHIMRERRLTEVDGARSPLNPDFHAKPIEVVKMEDQLEENAGITETARQKYLEPVAVFNHQKKDMGLLISISEPGADQSGDSDNLGSDIADGIRFSESLVSFKDVKGFEDFNIHVDGLILDSEIPMHLRTKYYELCHSQNMFLHDNLIQGLNSKLAAGMISETINIADAIRAAKRSTAPIHLESWDKTLKAFEDLGMVVGFLRARIHKLLSLSREYQAKIILKRTERAAAEDEMRALKMKLSDVKMWIENLDAEIDALKVKNEDLSFVFKEVSGASW